MKYALILTLALVSSAVFGQNVEFKGGNFKDDKDGFKNAVDEMKVGDEYREAGMEAIFATQDPGMNFTLAIKHYSVAQDFNPDNAELNFKLASCYAHTNDKAKMIDYMKRSIELDPEVDPFQNYYMGQALQLEGDFEGALKYFNKFEDEYKKADRFAKFLRQRKQECKVAPDLVNDPKRVWVDNLKAINSPADDFSPSITTDGAQLIFSSNRKNGHDQREDGSYDSDIYVSEWVNGSWTAPKAAPGALNTSEEDVCSMLSYDGTKMLLYRYIDEASGMDIYESRLNGLKWGAPEGFSNNVNTKDNQTYGSYSHDGVLFYYTNDRQLGSSVTGTDIYYTGAINAYERKYGTGQPMSDINTKFNEGPVYLHPDGKTMYFCSEGHNSMGGMDIYMSQKIQGRWTDPINLGYPINSPYDDMFFGVTASGKFAYIASNRAGGQGGFDLYKVTFWGPPKQPMIDTEDYLIASVANPIKDPQLEGSVEVERVSLTVFKGRTIDAITEKSVEAEIEIMDNATGKVINTLKTNSATGKFLLSLNAGKNYGIAVKADGYLFHSENFDIPEESDYNLVDKEIRLKNIAVGSKIALRNIFFATGSAELKPESNAELDRLVKLMKDVPGLIVEISGHTDNVGSPSMNQELSQKRAESVVGYLTKKGIQANRLTAKGYGEEQPVATNNSSEGRQQNRRVEFEILEN